MSKYRWNYSIGWAVEFVRKDAEITLDLDGKRSQKVISRGNPSSEVAEKQATEFCTKLGAKIEALIIAETATLKTARE